VVALELLARDATYAWDLVEGSSGFERRVLCANSDGKKPSRRETTLLVQSALSEVQPAAVFVPGWSEPHALAALEWCIRKKVPAVVMSETTAWDEPRKAWKERVKRLCVSLFSAGLVGGGPHRDYLASLGMPPDRIALGYDAVDNHYFETKAAEIRARQAEARSQHGLPEHYFLASSRFVEKKNLTRLLDAFALYRASAKCAPGSATWDLVLLGDGALRKSLEAQISASDLRGGVHMPGFKQYPDLPAYYALAGAFVHASTTEQWGLVVNEAMASGLPVLVSDRCGCASDLVQAGVNGFTFDPLDLKALAELFRKVSAPGFPIAQFGAASQRLIANWGPEAFAGGLEKSVACAMQFGCPKVSMAQRFWLKALQWR
jgi:glycosyltransferase involved in cell wall biosynthesis